MTLTAPLATAPPRARRMAVPVAVLGGLALATAALHLRDPHVSGSWGLCPSAAVGIWCPGCGGLRAVNDLTHLQVADAASSNLLLVAFLPFVVFWLGRWAVDRWRGVTRTGTVLDSSWFVVALLGAMAVFTVLRNLPPGSWLAP